MTFTKKTITPLVLLLASLAVACDSPTESDPEFDVTVTFRPDPTLASESSGVKYKVTNADDTVSYYDYPFRTSFTASIQDNAGLALDITSLNLTVQQATGGIVIPPSGGDEIHFKFNSSAVTKHINANGSADVGFDAWYDLPSGGKEALITVSFTFEHEDEDENVYTYSKTAQVRVAP